jgi:hypothetical protein
MIGLFTKYQVHDMKDVQHLTEPPPPTKMQTLVLIIPTTITHADCTRITEILKNLGRGDLTRRFDSVKILEPRTTENHDIWICQMAVSDPPDIIPTATCQAVYDAIKTWASSLGLYPKIAFQLSRAFAITN